MFLFRCFNTALGPAISIYLMKVVFFVAISFECRTFLSTSPVGLEASHIFIASLRFESLPQGRLRRLEIFAV